MTELSSQKETAFLFLNQQEAVELWGGIARQAHDLMPFRTDILSTYFNHLLSTHQRQKLFKMTGISLQNNPNDSIAYWYEGLIRLTTDEDPSLGLQNLKRAIALGVTRFLPIPKEEVESLMRAQ
jgi:hypothetical protein